MIAAASHRRPPGRQCPNLRLPRRPVRNRSCHASRDKFLFIVVRQYALGQLRKASRRPVKTPCEENITHVIVFAIKRYRGDLARVYRSIGTRRIDRDFQMKRFMLSALGAAAAIAVTASAAVAASPTMETVKKRGQLICGVNTGLAGFSAPDDKGVWKGFDVDYCRAMSAAVFGNPDKVTYKPLTGKTRFPALQSGEIDILSRNTTWTFKRDEISASSS